MLISINSGTVYFGANDVFENIDFSVKENEKIALVGRNGCGKTTLLKVLMGQVELSSGQLIKPNKLKVGYLNQNSLIDCNNIVKDELLSVFKPLLDMEERLNELSELMKTNHDDKIINEYSNLEEEFKAKGGYTYNSEMETILFGFGFKKDDLDKNVADFSGGEKTKLAFVKLLLSKPDLLLLDEPTNHLDLSTIEWLETYLSKYKKAIVLVSHDRIFLDKIVDSVYELEYGHIKKYAGNYSKFVEQKKLDFEKDSQAYVRQQKEIKRLEELIEKFRYKKSKAAFAQSKIKYLDRMEKLDDPKKADTKAFKATFKCAIKGGKSVLNMDHYKIGYDKPLFEVTHEILRGQRICVMGDNGSGKSTLLKTIIGQVPSLGGYMMLGHQIDIGYFDQNIASYKNGNTVLEELWNEYPDKDMYEIRSTLGAFLFSSDEVFKEVSVLSGGEKVRLALAKLMLKNANFLLLDEPTNNLDIVSKEALETALKNYDGTILFVSHDRYFIKQVATSCLVVENGELKYYPDGYKDYIDTNKKVEEVKEKTEKVDLKVVKARPKYNLRKLEEEISRLENLLEEKRALRFEPEYYQDSRRMQELDEEIDDIHNQIHAAEEKWEIAMEESGN